MYHREGNQEDFLVLAGECLLLVEGEERPLKAWDFVHCPPGTEHIFVGAGDGPCVVFMVGARGGPTDDDVYVRSELALRHGAGVETETSSSQVAYAPFERWQPGPPGSLGRPALGLVTSRVIAVVRADWCGLQDFPAYCGASLPSVRNSGGTSAALRAASISASRSAWCGLPSSASMTWA